MKNQANLDLYVYEHSAKQEGYQAVCGIDEAGRGPLAGPVFAAAVILPENCTIQGINDSKKLSPKKRELLFSQITAGAVAYGIGFATEKEVDKINILQATFRAMRRAVDQLSVKPDLAMVDGNQMPPLGGVTTRTIVKGDALSASIAAASILAKVSRDRLMRQVDKIYPQYGFAKHKGYGTAYHIAMLKKYGPCPVHRRTFLKKILGAGSDG